MRATVADVRSVVAKETFQDDSRFLKQQIDTLEATLRRSGFLSDTEYEKLQTYRQRLRATQLVHRRRQNVIQADCFRIEQITRRA